MTWLYSVFLIFGCILYINAFPEPDPVYNPHGSIKIIRPTYRPNNPQILPKLVMPTYKPNNQPKFIRLRRFVDGRQRFDGQNPPSGSNKPSWEIKPDIGRGPGGNTRGEVTIQKHGENHDVEAGYGRNIGGGKHGETWHVGGSVRW